jgi:hypothetical protein
MGRLIDDDVLETFAVVADPGDVADALIRRFGGPVTRLSFYVQGTADSPEWQDVVKALQAA